jgi:hypothetical protein
MELNPSRTTVDEQSKEFCEDSDGITIEVIAAARLLTEHFEKLGYKHWILGGVCSRKLLEKVQNRPSQVVPVPSPFADELNPAPSPETPLVPPSPWTLNPAWENFTHPPTGIERELNQLGTVAQLEENIRRHQREQLSNALTHQNPVFGGSLRGLAHDHMYRAAQEEPQNGGSIPQEPPF